MDVYAEVPHAMNHLPPTPDPWEVALSRSLKKLPDRPAPPTLLPRVMEAVAARHHRPWCVRVWAQTSSRQQAAALVLASVVVLLPLMYLASALLPKDWLAGANACRTVAGALGAACSAFCEDCVHIALAVAATLFVTLYLTCLGLGTAAYQLVRRP